MGLLVLSVGLGAGGGYERIEVDWRDRRLVLFERVIPHTLLEVIPEARSIERPKA